MHTNLWISTAGTILASTYSLLPSAWDAVPRREGDSTKVNNTKTEVSLVQPHKLEAYGNDAPGEIFPDHIYSICHRSIS